MMKFLILFIKNETSRYAENDILHMLEPLAELTANELKVFLTLVICIIFYVYY